MISSPLVACFDVLVSRFFRIVVFSFTSRLHSCSSLDPEAQHRFRGQLLALTVGYTLR